MLVQHLHVSSQLVCSQSEVIFEILNEQFKSVFTTESIDNIPNKGVSLHPVITQLAISCKHVFVLSGPDVCISLYIFVLFHFEV
jgi:hypothetical protein